jgi:16S rRNA processing protein RimM
VSAPGAGRIAVGRVGRPHGVRGDVQVQVLTDEPELRFAAGRRLHVGEPLAPATAGPDVADPVPAEVVVQTVRWHHGRLLVGFDGIADRQAAQSLRGRALEIEPAEAGDAGPDAWWDHELVGLAAQLDDGTPLGPVTQVVHVGSQNLLALRLADGREVLVPFVAAVVPVVDPAGGRLVVHPPEGLLEL